MRISELSRVSDVPTATIKYYLRERLLHDGLRTSATQAQYDDTHVARLRLIRALLGPAGLSVARTRQVLEAIDDAEEPSIELLGIAHGALVQSADPDRDLSRVEEMLQRWDWCISAEDRDGRAALLDALEAIDAAGFEPPADVIDRYAQVMLQVATTELDHLPTDSAEAAVRYVVLGTVLNEPLILALRRLAQQHVSRRRFGSNRPPPEPPGPPGPPEPPQPSQS